MYYLNISQEDPNKLIYYCRNCGFEDRVNEASNVIQVLNTTVGPNKRIDFSHIVNKYTKYDPTLPLLENGECPNEKCGKRNILYMRYDDEALKFLYLCKDCDHIWT